METYENEIAFFIRYASGKIEAFDTAAARKVALDEIAADDAAWRVA